MDAFVGQALSLMDTELERIAAALSRLSEEQVWQRPRECTNSVGNLCLHLAGNEYQHFVSGIGGRPFIRDRSGEFLADAGWTPEQLRKKLCEVREQSRGILERLRHEDLSRSVEIYYPPESGIATYARPIQEILFHVANHYSYHTGQIVLLTKLMQSGHEHLLKWRH